MRNVTLEKDDEILNFAKRELEQEYPAPAIVPKEELQRKYLFLLRLYTHEQWDVPSEEN